MGVPFGRNTSSCVQNVLVAGHAFCSRRRRRKHCGFPLCEASLLPLACRVRLGRPSAIESPPRSGGGSNVFARPFSKGRVPFSFTIPSAFRNFAFPAKFQPMAPLHGAGPLRRSEGVSKICPARSEAEEQRVQIFSPNGTAAVFRFLFGGKKEQPRST